MYSSPPGFDYYQPLWLSLPDSSLEASYSNLSLTGKCQETYAFHVEKKKYGYKRKKTCDM